MKLERVAVGIDFSEPSLAAARWTARHFAPGAEIVLVHAVDIPQPPRFLRGRFPPHDELVRNARDGAERRLRELGGALGADRVWLEVPDGRPAEEITRVAKELEVDVVVVGERGRHRGAWGALGSTAERLLHESPVPVLVARGLPDGPPRRILAPIDESDTAFHAAEWARFLADRFGADVIGLHVLHPALYGHVSAVSVQRKAHAFMEDLRAQGEQWLRDRLGAAGLPADRTAAIVAYGEPRHEILATQQREGVDLIVMGSRGAGAVGRTLLGSVASGVIRGTGCPALVVTEAARE